MLGKNFKINLNLIQLLKMIENLIITSSRKPGEPKLNKEVKEIIYGDYDGMPIKEIFYVDESHEIWNFSQKLPYEPLLSCAYRSITKEDFDELVKYSVKKYKIRKIKEKENLTSKEIKLVKKLEKEYWNWVDKKNKKETERRKWVSEFWKEERKKDPNITWDEMAKKAKKLKPNWGDFVS